MVVFSASWFYGVTRNFEWPGIFPEIQRSELVEVVHEELQGQPEEIVKSSRSSE